MDSKAKSEQNRQFYLKLTEIVELYNDSTVLVLFNDLVKIGTWPTPEHPENVPKIDTVPLPEKPRRLKKIIDELLAFSANIPINKLI